MAWGRLDDGFDDHPKVVALLDEDDLTTAGVAVGLWTLCWAWAHRNTRKRGKTPGLLPAGLPRRFLGQAGKDAVQLLVKHRLWDPADDGGWLIHDFVDFLPTEETREARAEAGRKGAAKRWAGHQKASGQNESDAADGNLPSACHDADSNAVASDGSRTPARWDSHSHTQTQTQESDPPSVDLFGATAQQPAKKRARKKPPSDEPRERTRIPDDFAVDEAMAAWAKEEVPLVDWPFETGQFRDYWKNRDDKGAAKLDWIATWRTWMRKRQRELSDRGITRRWQPGAEHQGRAGSELARRPSSSPEVPRRSTAAARAEQGLAVADALDRKYGHGKYATEGAQ